MRGIFLSLISLCLSHYCSSQVKQNRYELVLTNVNVVDIANNKVIPDQLIAISDNTIKAIDQANRVNIFKADRYVNGSGKYVLPGLWDMHVHFRGGDSLIAANKKLLPIFLAYGITTVRECGGDLTPAVLEWKHQIEKGNLAGPRI